MIGIDELINRPEMYLSFSYLDKSVLVVGRRKGSYFDVVCRGFIPSLGLSEFSKQTIKRGSNFVVRCLSIDDALDVYRLNVAEVVGEL